MTNPRLDSAFTDDIYRFISATIKAWVDAGIIHTSSGSWGVELRIARHLEITEYRHASFASDDGSGLREGQWYVDNAAGKNEICALTGMDSFEAIQLHPGLVVGLDGAFPWGGAVIDNTYRVIVGTSGFLQVEDILVSRTIKAYITMRLDQIGQSLLDDARERGKQEGEAGRDRFTVAI